MPELSVLAIFIITIVMSIRGFNDALFFRKYMFEVSSIRYRKEYYRLFSSGFLHAGWAHLLFNMITLYFFYSVPMTILGEMRFLIIFFVGLGFSSLYSYWVNKNDYSYSAVGASGAVSAVLFSAIILNPHMTLFIIPIPLPIPAWLFAVAYILFSSYGMRKKIGNIGHSAHLGGAAAGILLTVIMHPEVFTDSPWVSSLMIVLVVVLMINEMIRQKR
ncbi:MAG: rhomboid family intramembrane serine protease [Flavobacteriales bacterium]|nr:rhomboid family intramembrane serine protease [Flavobacteriales bacterium]